MVGKRSRTSGLVGVISDTHGLLRPEAVTALTGCALILHAGDVGDASVLDGLREIAPVVAVRGNNDTHGIVASLPEVVVTNIHDARVCVIHELSRLAVDLAKERIDVVVYGHSHRPAVECRGATLFLNPGSAGPRRFTLPVALARLHVDAKEPRAEIVTLV
jgi:hypothetical protein